MNGYLFFNMTAFQFAAVLTLLSCVVYATLQPHIGRPQNRIFVWCMVSLLTQAILNILSTALAGYVPVIPGLFPLVKVLDLIYVALHAAMMGMIYFYYLYATKMIRRRTKGEILAALSPVFIGEALILTNPLHELVYQYSENYRIHRVLVGNVLYVASVVYITVVMLLLVVRWFAISASRKKILLFTYIVFLIGLAIQLFLPEVKTELFAEAILYMGIMISVQYDEELIDAATGVYNRSALIADIHQIQGTRVSFCCVMVQFQNVELLTRILGCTGHELVQILSPSLTSLHPLYLTYRLSPYTFLMMLADSTRDKAKELAEKVQRQLLTDWESAEQDTPLQFSVLYAAIPEELKGSEDILLLSENLLPENSEGEVLAGEDLKDYFSKTSMFEALTRIYREKKIQISYRLVYSANRRRVEAAEAIMTLADPELGILEGADFMNAAETMGMTRQFGEYLIREVCAFLATETPDRLGIRYVGVHLSMIQCMNPEFVNLVIGIAQEYGVDPSRICFQIAETAAGIDYRSLEQIIHDLKNLGFLFALEKYGTGTANMYLTFSMNFDFIIMDWELLDAAVTSEAGMIILESNVLMAKDLKRRVCLTGIHTPQRLADIQHIPIDYLEGDFFAAPLTREELSARSALA